MVSTDPMNDARVVQIANGGTGNTVPFFLGVTCIGNETILTIATTERFFPTVNRFELPVEIRVGSRPSEPVHNWLVPPPDYNQAVSLHSRLRELFEQLLSSDRLAIRIHDDTNTRPWTNVFYLENLQEAMDIGGCQLPD